MTDEQPPNGPARWVGSDRVLLNGDRLVIHSPYDMPDWQARPHRKPLIRYEGRTWRIDRKLPGFGDTIRYELSEWCPGSMELVGREIHYGSRYVRRRDLRQARLRRHNRTARALAVASPVIGFFGQETKRRLEVAYGIDPVAATRRSLYVEYWILLTSATLLSIGVLVSAVGGAAPWPLAPLGSVFIIAGVDALVRKGRLLAEQRHPPGFYEWLWRPLFKGRPR